LEISLSIQGSGRIIKYFSPESVLFKLIGNLSPEEIHNLLYSEKFQMLNLRMENEELASTFFEVVPDQQHIAFDLDRITRLEIKLKNKTRSKILLREIVSENLLFPLYNYNLRALSKQFSGGILIIENDIGSFGKCKLELDNFDVDNLFFEIVQYGLPLKSVVFSVLYDGKELEFRKRDSLFNGNVVVIK